MSIRTLVGPGEGPPGDPGQAVVMVGPTPTASGQAALAAPSRACLVVQALARKSAAAATLRAYKADTHAMTGYGFFTAGETPLAAMAQLGARWQALRFALVPRAPD